MDLKRLKRDPVKSSCELQRSCSPTYSFTIVPRTLNAILH